MARYNKTVHSFTGETPFDVELNPDLHDKILLKFARKYYDVKPQEVRYRVGDVVRILLYRGKFSRSYNIQRSYERFKIKRVTHQKVPRYVIEDEKGREIDGFFYAHELTRVQLSRYRSSVIGEKRDRAGVKWLKIAYKGYPEEFNEWRRSDELDLIPI